jgi:hypothetical protein
MNADEPGNVRIPGASVRRRFKVKLMGLKQSATTRILEALMEV